MTAPLEAGMEILPGYEVIEHLSRGRRLDVYDVWSDLRGSRCIVKCIRPEREGEERARRLLLEEGELLMRLSHPHLVRVYEVHVEPRPAIVMETLGGETLAHVIVTGRQLSAPELGHLAMHLGSAVGYLHRNGVLHLDLKPSNVVADGGRAKVIDLSVARPPGSAPSGIGTPDFMSPEQARGGELGPAADVWGIGIVLHELLTGERAFAVEPGSSTGETLTPSEDWTDEGESWETGEEGADEEYRQVEERAPLLAGRTDVSQELASLVDACLEPDPAKRPAVTDLLARAEQVAELPAEQRRWSAR